MALRSSVVTLAAVVLAVTVVDGASAATGPDERRVREGLARLQVPFVENQGQADRRVAYYAPTFTGTVFVTRRGELVYSLPQARRGSGPAWTLVETLPGGAPRPAPRDASAIGVSYFLGAERERWRPRVPTFDGVSLGEVWPGVTVDVRAGGRTVEKVFTLAPGARVDRIRVRVRGARGLSVDAAGALVAATERGSITFTAPVAYQEHDGVRRPVTVAYRVAGREYGFTVGEHDQDLPLTIDPLLQSTYLGGGALDAVHALAIHPTSGDVYAAGFTNSTDFPGVAGGAQPTKAGELEGSAFVARLSADLTTLIQATYLGGSTFCNTKFCQAPGDEATALAFDRFTGDVFVAGRTRSPSFPGTAGAAQPTHAGGDDAFVALLSPSLTTLTRATYLGGTGGDGAAALAVQPLSGDVYVAGFSDSPSLPGTAGAAQPGNAGAADAFVSRLSSSLTTIGQTTFLGGTAHDRAAALSVVGLSGDVYVAGTTFSSNFPGTVGGAQPVFGGQADGFVARLNGSLTTLEQATYLGGGFEDLLNSLAIHPMTGDVYVAGGSPGGGFPGTAGGGGAFVARLASSLTVLLHATLLGGNGGALAFGVAIHPVTGDVYVAGWTTSLDFPGTAGSIQPVKPKPQEALDGFVARLPASLATLTRATYLGGPEVGGDAIFALAIAPGTGDVYVAGATGSSDFPGVAGGAQSTLRVSDGFVARLTSDLGIGADLAIAKVRDGNFLRDLVGVVYTLTVTNVGHAPSRGAVTVVDRLGAGLTAASLAGTGWACTLVTLTCTRGDPLAAGSSFPAISLVVTAGSDAPDSVTNSATVSGGADLNPANNRAVDRVAIGTFGDVPPDRPFFTWIEALVRAGITGGCASSPPQYCSDIATTRAQMAVLILRGIHGAGFSPPPPTGTMFADVPANHPFAAWIEELALEGITTGCASGPPRYCPDAAVTRAEMAVFLLRSIHGSGYVPPPAVGLFVDVPASTPFAAWIEQLAREGITTGCATAPPRYCPGGDVTRGQMAVFLTRSFELTLPTFRPVLGYVANSGRRSVTVFDTSNDAVVGSIEVGQFPGVVVANPDGTRVYVSTIGESTVSVVDTTAASKVAAVPTGTFLFNLFNLAVNPAGTRLYVSDGGGNTVLVVDTATNTVVDTFTVGAGPREMAVHPDGSRLYVADSTPTVPSLAFVDTATGAVTARADLGADMLTGTVVVHPAGTRVYVLNIFRDRVAVVDTSTNTVVTNVGVGASAVAMALRPDGARLYVASRNTSTVTVIDTATNTAVKTIVLAAGAPGAVAVHPDGSRVYVTTSDGTVQVIDTATDLVVGNVPLGHPAAGGLALAAVPFVPGAAADASATGAPASHMRK